MCDQDRDPLFAKGSYLVFDATEAEALHAEGMEAEGVDVRDMQRKLRASCREDHREMSMLHYAQNAITHV